MKIAQIWVDGRGYQGEHIDDIVGPPGNPNQMNRLMFGDEPYEIGGETSLLSHLERIIRQLRRGYIEASRIEIEVRDEPHGYETAHSLVHGWEGES